MTAYSVAQPWSGNSDNGFYWLRVNQRNVFSFSSYLLGVGLFVLILALKNVMKLWHNDNWLLTLLFGTRWGKLLSLRLFLCQAHTSTPLHLSWTPWHCWLAGSGLCLSNKTRYLEIKDHGHLPSCPEHLVLSSICRVWWQPEKSLGFAVLGLPII